MAQLRRHPKIAKEEVLEPWAEGPMLDRDSQPHIPSYSSGNQLILLEADYKPSSLQSGVFPAKQKEKHLLLDLS